MVKDFFILQGDIYEVYFSLLLRSTPVMIFSGHILFRIRKRSKVLKIRRNPIPSLCIDTPVLILKPKFKERAKTLSQLINTF